MATQRTYIREDDFIAALKGAITADGDGNVKFFTLETMMGELREKYPEAKEQSVRQRVYKVNKALDGERRFVANRNKGSTCNLAAYLAL